MGRKKIEYRVEHCEWCGRKVKPSWSFPERDNRYLIYTTLGHMKICGRCHLDYQINDRLPEVKK